MSSRRLELLDVVVDVDDDDDDDEDDAAEEDSGREEEEDKDVEIESPRLKKPALRWIFDQPHEEQRGLTKKLDNLLVKPHRRCFNGGCVCSISDDDVAL